jgi:Ser/Thr protein kinase RdoA (MazF antagonist)
VLIDDAELLSILGLPAATSVEWEPLGVSPDSPCRVFLGEGDGASRSILVRALNSEEAHNHAAVLEALNRTGFTHAPQLLAFGAGWLAEEWIDGVTALALVPPEGSAPAAMDAFAALRALDLREGLRWEQRPSEILPMGELPLHRLGFAAEEREQARAPLADAQALLLESRFGFVHGDAMANHLLLAPGRATLVDFASAGHGPQLFDVTAFLLTSGLQRSPRRSLAEGYAASAGLPPDSTADLVDLFGILWGIGELLALPHRHIRALGDDTRSHQLNTAAGRIERGVREPAGSHPVAAAIRAALWQQ